MSSNITPANPLSALAAAELAAAATPIINALTQIQNGDGSVASITGQGLALEGELLAILPTLQKIGVQNVAAFLVEKIQEAIAGVTPTGDSSEPKAA